MERASVSSGQKLLFAPNQASPEEEVYLLFPQGTSVQGSSCSVPNMFQNTRQRPQRPSMGKKVEKQVFKI